MNGGFAYDLGNCCFIVVILLLMLLRSFTLCFTADLYCIDTFLLCLVCDFAFFGFVDLLRILLIWCCCALFDCLWLCGLRLIWFCLCFFLVGLRVGGLYGLFCDECV